MLENLFLHILNMSFIGGVVILFILVARIILKKAPKIFSYSLWAVALLRLVFPFSFESILSLIPVNPGPISQDMLYNQTPKVNTGIGGVDYFINSSLPAGTPYASVNPMQILILLGSILWVVGVWVFLSYSFLSLYRLKNKLKNAVCERDNIYLASCSETPFVLGIIKPKIYLPTVLSSSEKEYIILHEQTHIKRFDHVVRLISFLTLCIHWFNPLVWVAFNFSGKDMEMSCDESVIRHLGDSVKKDYSTSLLTLATGRKNLGMTPLAFGEGDTKGRIKNIINLKKPKFYISVVAIIILLVAGIGLLSNPKNEEPDLSLLNSGNFFSSMATGGYIAAETENNGDLGILANGSFLELFEHGKWKEKKVNAPLESTATLKIILQDGYYTNFYSYEDYAMIYHEDTQEKYRYYTIPAGVYEALESYILENGEPINVEIPAIMSTGEVDGVRDIGYMSGFEESGGTRITFDPLEWITLDDTDRIEQLGIEEYDMPNGYYIHNPEVEELEYELDGNTEYRFIDWGNNFAKSDEERFHYSTTNKEEFLEYLNTYTDKAVKFPFWIRHQDGLVQVIEEQYVP